MQALEDERLALAKALALGLTVLCQLGTQSADYLAMERVFHRLDFTESERETFLTEAAISLNRLLSDEKTLTGPTRH